MNKVLVRTEGIRLPSLAIAAKIIIKKALKIMGKKNWEVSVFFCGNDYIRNLNRQYRNKDEPTDVLTFSQDSDRDRFPEGTLNGTGKGWLKLKAAHFTAGDIVISIDALAENTRFFNVSADEELRRLLVHGILHLAGYDHASNKTEEPMLKTQEEILARLAEKTS